MWEVMGALHGCRKEVRQILGAGEAKHLRASRSGNCWSPQQRAPHFLILDQSRIKLLETRFRNKLVGPSNPIYDEKVMMIFLVINRMFLFFRSFTVWPPFLHCENFRRPYIFFSR